MNRLTKKRSAQLITEHDIAPIGRPPTTIKDLPKNWEDICIECGLNGGSDLKIRVELGISDTAWYTLLKNSPDFSNVIKRSKQLSIIWWEEAGQSLTNGQMKGSAVVWIFNMKNRCGWRDQSNINHSSSDGSMSPAKEIKIEIMEITDGNDDDD